MGECAGLLMVYYWYLMIFWEVLLERFVGKLCGGAEVLLAKAISK